MASHFCVGSSNQAHPHPHDGDDNDRGFSRVAPWGMRLASWLAVPRTGLPREEAVVFCDVTTWRRIPHTNHDLSMSVFS